MTAILIIVGAIQKGEIRLKITFIDHSGFFLECEDCCLLFDYYRGNLPEPKEKPLIIFSSHSHPDHYNPEIFSYGRRWQHTRYVLSDEIPVPESAAGEEIYLLGPQSQLTLVPDIKIETLQSTDIGIAYLVTHGGKTIFHAGDLHLWLWNECTEEENVDMTTFFHTCTAPLKGREIDYAFLPVDPRQGAHYWKGFDYFMRLCTIKYAFPMHFWGKFEYLDKLKRRPEAAAYTERIIRLTQKGEHYEL